MYWRKSFESQSHKTYLRIRTPSEESDQTAHSRSLIRFFTGRVLDSQGCNVSSCRQLSLSGDCAEAKAVHVRYVFLKLRLIWTTCTFCLQNEGWSVTGKIFKHSYCLFVLRFYGPVNPVGSCRARSVYLTTRLLGRQSSKRLTSIVHILSPETDNCHS